MASGWNLWVWLQYIGVASGCCCKEVYSLTIIFPTLLVLALFFGSSIFTSLFIFKMFFPSCSCYFFAIYKQTLLKEHSRSFKKSRSREYND